MAKTQQVQSSGKGQGVNCRLWGRLFKGKFIDAGSQNRKIVECILKQGRLILDCLTLKVPNKNCSRQHFNFLLLSLEENEADFSCEQRIHLKYQVLFSLKNNEKIFMNVVCCSHDCDWPFKGQLWGLS